MAIKVGDRLPNATFFIMGADGPKSLTTDEIFKGKKVVLFAVPGAFTPTCHKNHLPSYVQNLAALKTKGVDTIALVAVNDVFVLDAWKKAANAEGIEFLSDGNAEFAKMLGLDLDATGRGLGIRSQRYAMLVEDGLVKVLNIEDAPSKADVSTAESLMKAF